MITTTPRSHGLVVRIAGRLEAADLPELARALDAHGVPIEIELSQLVTADASSLDFLRRREGEGAVLTGASPYVGLLLGDPRLPGDAPDGVEPCTHRRTHDT